ncbi:hypothetical protein TVAG_137850 [Trichomonas vaginalis G3]|uniref:Uncharacterized protein n=1 Tax=Trichomonas vaginalis (strain ATCC PRA-98 / G3) TaxID=412133 RepID=A2EC18_TRIV3|nr:gene silencing by RNA [Trichomonas vaginalis G3]EAY09793.1 hypothetical protein TVAG_137850 [Trichomonas vaginalis G3]KAI5525744.1 gene silencing by RNA [Trichomonas vaginalis G3]|eukprot:XP_001322016.1 hypothetical protein [Trichomonas vaginalis G3]
MHHSTITESILNILETNDQSLDEISTKFHHAYDFNDRSALLSAISILILEGILDSHQKIIGVWLIFMEYSKLPISQSPFFEFFKSIDNPIQKDDSNAINLSKLILIQSQNLTKIGEMKPGEAKINLDNDEKKKFEEKYSIDKIQAITAVENILQRTPAIHHPIFLEVLFLKIINKPVDTILDMLKSDNYRDFGEPGKFTISALIEVSSFLKDDLRYAYAAILSFFKFSRDALNQLPDEAYAPIIFFHYIKELCDDNNSPKSGEFALFSLKNYDLFDIIGKWIDISYNNFSKQFFTLISIHLQSLLYLVIKTQTPPDYNFICSNILPLLCKVAVKERPTPFTEATFRVILPGRGRRQNEFTKLYKYFQAICKDSSTANLVKRVLNDDLKKSHVSTSNVYRRKCLPYTEFSDFLSLITPSLISSSNITENSLEYCAFVLFHKLIKYSESTTVKESLIRLVTNRFYTDHTNSAQNIFPYVVEFLSSPKLAPYAAKIISNTIELAPVDSINYINTKLHSNYSNFEQIVQSTNSDDSVIAAFITVARNMNSLYFKYKSPVKEIPSFTNFILKDTFHMIVHHKFQSKYNKWKILKSLVDACKDLLDTDDSFCDMIHQSETFSSALLSLITVSAAAINPNDQQNQTDQVYVDRVDVNYPLECEISTLKFLKIVLSRYLEKNKELSPLCKLFFNTKSDVSGIFSTLIGFLAVQLPGGSSEELAGISLSIIEILCKIAAMMKDVSVDAYYPEEKQKILNQIAKGNLIDDSSGNHYISMLDFIANTLMTQPAFAFSFVQHTAKSIFQSMIKAKKIEKFEDSRLLLSLSRLIANMYRKLSANSKTLKEIAGSDTKSDFWSQAKKIIKLDDQNPDPNIILAQSFLMQAHLCYLCSHVGQAKAEIDDIGVTNMIRSVVNKLSLTKIEISEELKLEIDLSKFHKDRHEYGDDYYVDIDLLKFYYEDIDQKFVEELKKFNKDLSVIDATTQYISTIIDYIKLYALIDPDSPKFNEDGKSYDHKELIELVKNVMNNNLPESLITTVSKLGLLLITNFTGGFWDFVNTDYLKSFNRYLKKHKTPAVLELLNASLGISENRVYSQADLRADHSDSDYPNLKFHQLEKLFDKCVQILISDKLEIAADCLINLAIKLNCFQQFLQNPERIALLTHACHLLISDDVIGSKLVIALSVLCNEANRANDLANSGILDSILEIKLPKNSLVWPPLFKLISGLPIAHDYAANFAKSYLPIINFFLSETTTSYQIQNYLTTLLFNMHGHFNELSHENPYAFNGLMQLVFIRMKKALADIRDVTMSKEEKYSQWKTLLNCLMIFNAQFDFPETEIPGFSDNAENKNQSFEIVKRILDHFGKILQDNKFNIDLLPLFLMIYETSTSLFIGLIMMTNNLNESTNEDAISSFKAMTELVTKNVKVLMQNVIDESEKQRIGHAITFLEVAATFDPSRNELSK